MAKASLHGGGGKSGSVIHNDKARSFIANPSISGQYDYIDTALSHQNDNIIFDTHGIVVTDQSLVECYHQRYAQVYEQALYEQNEKYMQKRNYDRVKTIDDWRESERYGAREMILQIGSEKAPATINGKELTPEELKEHLECCLSDLDQYCRDLLGEHYQPMYAAVHMDETTPHIHWDYSIAEITKSGSLKPGLNKGLEQAGIALPDPERAADLQSILQEQEDLKAAAENREPKTIKATSSKYNNRLVTLTGMIRDKWEDLILARGIEIERSERCERMHEDQNRHRQAELVQEVKNTRVELSDAQMRLANAQAEIDNLSDRLDALRAAEDAMIASQRSLNDDIQNLIAKKAELEAQIDDGSSAAYQQVAAYWDQFDAKPDINRHVLRNESGDLDLSRGNTPQFIARNYKADDEGNLITLRVDDFPAQEQLGLFARLQQEIQQMVERVVSYARDKAQKLIDSAKEEVKAIREAAEQKLIDAENEAKYIVADAQGKADDLIADAMTMPQKMALAKLEAKEQQLNKMIGLVPQAEVQQLFNEAARYYQQPAVQKCLASYDIDLYSSVQDIEDVIEEQRATVPRFGSSDDYMYLSCFKSRVKKYEDIMLKPHTVEEVEKSLQSFRNSFDRVR